MNSRVVPVFVTYKLEADRFVKLNDLCNKVIFVDNSENKLSDIKLRGLHILWNEKNLGYGGGANVGMEEALKLGADWIIVLNQDLKINRKDFENLADELKNTDPAVLGPFVGGLEKNRWTAVLPSKNVDYISGACIAIHKDVIDTIGNFYSPYFMYYEDVDYCVRAKKSGFPLIKSRVLGIRHEDNSSLGRSSFLHEYYLARNHLLFIEREAPLSVKIYEGLRLPRSYSEYLTSNNGGLSGVSDYLMRRFGEKSYENRR